MRGAIMYTWFSSMILVALLCIESPSSLTSGRPLNAIVILLLPIGFLLPFVRPRCDSEFVGQCSRYLW